MAAGDDLIVRLEVADNHQPKPNIARSAGYILRWPVRAPAPSEGVEGIVQESPAGLLPQPAPDHHRCRGPDRTSAPAGRRGIRRSAPMRSAWTRASCACATASSSARKASRGGAEAAGPQTPPTTRTSRTSTMRRPARARPRGWQRHQRAGVRQRHRRAVRVRPYPRPRRGRDPARSRDPRHAEGRAGPDVAGRRRAAPGPARAGLALRNKRAGLHQAGAAGRRASTWRGSVWNFRPSTRAVACPASAPACVILVASSSRPASRSSR